MKKLLVLIISILLISVIAIVLYTRMFKVEKPLYTKINTEQIENMKKEKKDFVVYLYQDNCAGCKRMKPIINEYIKETNSDIYAVDVNNSDDVKYLSNVLQVKKTPTFVFYKNGEESDREVGQISKEDIENKANVVQ